MADEDTTTDETEDTGTGTETDGTETEETEEWTPPTRDEWEAAQKAQRDTADALKKANGQAAKHRSALRELEQKHEDDDTRAKREATEAAFAALKPVAIRAEARSAFLAAGADVEKATRLVRLLDLSKVEIDGDTVTGLDEQVDDLKAEFPELFSPPKDETPKRKPAAATEVGSRKPAPAALSPLEQLTAQLQGRK